MEYQLTSGTHVHASQMAPENFHYVVLQDDESALHRTLKGMCENSSRQLRWVGAGNKDIFLSPLIEQITLDAKHGNVELLVRVRHITPPEDYDIHTAMRNGNYSRVIDMIDDQHGVNAIDEYGQSILMTAVQLGVLPVVASLLNVRRPRVDVNLAKGNGFTALFYALDLKQPSILQALLRRGGNPNSALDSEGNRGNTPLHVSCRFELREHTKMLLEYGALPDAVNDYGQMPLALLPRAAVLSTKRAFKKHFDEAAARINEAAAEGLELPRPAHNGEL
jgi:hypothetical protein